jgi:hypothetical protein
VTVSAEARAKMSAAAKERWARQRAERGLCTWTSVAADTHIRNTCGQPAVPGGLLCERHQAERDEAEAEPLTVGCACGWKQQATRGTAGRLFRKHRAAGCGPS